MNELVSPRETLTSAIWIWTNLTAWRVGLSRSVLLLTATSGAANGGSKSKVMAVLRAVANEQPLNVKKELLTCCLARLVCLC